MKAGKGFVETTNNNNALVSIIIPAYNTEQYIHRAIESSIRQTYKNIEIIIIDDGSTDGTLRVAQSYEPKDSRVKVFHQENKGVSSARNYGIREAKGEFITFLDSDDWFEDNAVEVLVEAQLKYPDKLINAEYYKVVINPDNSFCRVARNKNKSSRIITIEETIATFALGDIYLPITHAKIYKTNIIRKYNISFKEHIHYGEDQLFFMDYLYKTNGLVYINHHIQYVLSRPGSTMRVPYEKRKERIKDYLQVMIDYPENSASSRRVLKAYHSTMFMGELAMALWSKVSADEIKYLQNKTRLYMAEFFNLRKPTIYTRLNFIFKTFMPIPLIKMALRIKSMLGKMIILYRDQNPEGEPIPYW